jgi:hypothetical protein
MNDLTLRPCYGASEPDTLGLKMLAALIASGVALAFISLAFEGNN